MSGNPIYGKPYMVLGKGMFTCACGNAMVRMAEMPLLPNGTVDMGADVECLGARTCNECQKKASDEVNARQRALRAEKKKFQQGLKLVGDE